MPGGPSTHRTDCRCRPCTAARTRAAKAVANGAGIASGTITARAITPKLRQTPKAREHVAQWLALRLAEPTLTPTQLAERLGISKSRLHQAIRQGVRERWLQLDDPMELLEHQLLPKVVNGLDELLTTGASKGDKVAIIETAKATLFPVWRDHQGLKEGAQVNFALKIEMQAPPTISNVAVDAIEGQIVGRPKQIGSGNAN